MSNPIKKISKVELWGVLSRADELISLATDKTTARIQQSLENLLESAHKALDQEQQLHAISQKAMELQRLQLISTG